MMKSKDVCVATSLIIQGYIRSNWTGGSDLALLRDAIAAIRRECSDWAENLEGEHSPTSRSGMTLGDLAALVKKLKSEYSPDTKVLLHDAGMFEEHGLVSPHVHAYPAEPGSPAFIEIEAAPIVGTVSPGFDPTGPGTPAWEAGDAMIESGRALVKHFRDAGKPDTDIELCLLDIKRQALEPADND